MLLNKDDKTDPRVQKEAKSLRSLDEHQVGIFSNRRKINTKSKIRFGLNVARFYVECVREARRLDKLWKLDAVHAHDLDTLPLGVLLTRLHDIPLIYDAHEVYAYMIREDVGTSFSSALLFIERRLTRWATRVIAVSQNVAVNVTERPNDCVLVMNCPGDPPPMAHVPREGGALRLGYFGSLEPGRFVLAGINAVEATPGWEMIIAGSGSLEGAVKTRTSDRVHFIGQMPHERSVQMMGACDLQLLMFDPNNANSRIGMPNRLFEAMSLGKPVVATYYTDSGRLVQDLDCGFAVGYESSSLASLLLFLKQYPGKLAKLGENGHRAWEDQYNWGRQELALLSMYHALSGGGVKDVVN